MNDKKVFIYATAGAVLIVSSIFISGNALRKSQQQTLEGENRQVAAVNSNIPGIFWVEGDQTGYPFQIFGIDEADAAIGPSVNEAGAGATPGQIISPYDQVMREVSEREGADWRLMAAIAYNESRFKPDVVSNKGAKGLMQIMPVVSRQFGIPDEKVMDPAVNVTLAIKLLNKIEAMMKIPETVHNYDRMALVLASYNCGIGHVSDARRLAAKYGDNPNSWDDVSKYLKRKAQPEYYQDGVVCSGRFSGGSKTLAFVNGVMGMYNSYCTLAAL